MKLASTKGISWSERNAFRWFRIRKRIYQLLRHRNSGDSKILFVVGCQRSGTSMLSHIFRRDWNVVTFDEVSPLSSADPEGLRWDPLPDVARRLQNKRAPLIVCKPLVESQNLTQMLDAFPGSRAVWMYRDYHDVAWSNLKFFGGDNGRNDLAPIVAGDQSDWRVEHADERHLEVVRGCAAAEMNDWDAAALFWWVRNQLFFSRAYSEDPRVIGLDYNDLVSQPEPALESLYRHVGIEFPGQHIYSDVFSSSRGNGQKITLRPDVEVLCRQLLARLKDATS
ncbi:MAG: hypothetical protein ACI9UQ_000208 [Candidatus Krumholzibacteriia bacterium]